MLHYYVQVGWLTHSREAIIAHSTAHSMGSSRRQYRWKGCSTPQPKWMGSIWSTQLQVASLCTVIALPWVHMYMYM